MLTYHRENMQEHMTYLVHYLTGSWRNTEKHSMTIKLISETFQIYSLGVILCEVACLWNYYCSFTSIKVDSKQIWLVYLSNIWEDQMSRGVGERHNTLVTHIVIRFITSRVYIYVDHWKDLDKNFEFKFFLEHISSYIVYIAKCSLCI